MIVFVSPCISDSTYLSILTLVAIYKQIFRIVHKTELIYVGYPDMQKTGNLTAAGLFQLVGVTRLELATSCTPSKHSSHLSYTPTNLYNFTVISKTCQE